MSEIIKIQYVYNSCFTIDYRDCFIIIDYAEGALSIPPNRKVLFLVTHGHADHYTPDIFRLPGSERAFYILSDDIRPPRLRDNILLLSRSEEDTEQFKRIYDPSRVRRTHPGDHFFVEGIPFRIFGSTDLGTSIHFQLGEVSFFHSGDLNAWKWAEFTPQEQQKEVDDYVRILEQIRPYPIDVGFGVVDPRLGAEAMLGPHLYLDLLQPQIFIPMHFREHPEITADCARQLARPGCRIQTIEGAGEQILIHV